MKKSLALGILGLTAAVASSYGQGFVALDTYNTSGPFVTFGAGVAGHAAGSAVVAGMGYTVGVYFAQGNQTGGTALDASGVAIPTDLNALLLLGTGTGSTANFVAGGLGYDGSFLPAGNFNSSSVVDTPQAVTLMIVAYDGADYASSLFRGHSQAFSLTDALGTSPTPVRVGSFMQGFQVFTVPEPSVMALAGLGLASLLFARRRK